MGYYVYRLYQDKILDLISLFFLYWFKKTDLIISIILYKRYEYKFLQIEWLKWNEIIGINFILSFFVKNA